MKKNVNWVWHISLPSLIVVFRPPIRSPRFAIVGDTSRLRRSQPRRIREKQSILCIGYREIREGLIDRVGCNLTAPKRKG